MSSNHRARLMIPILIIALGVGWLLTAEQVGGINWIWTIMLGVVGILAFVVSGFDKVSVVIGPFFLIASVLSILRQVGHLRVDVEVPLLVITIGVLLLIAQQRVIPAPAWLVPLGGDDKKQ